MTETSANETAMSLAFERALANVSPTYTANVAALESQIAALYEENRNLRTENGELRSTVVAQRTQLKESEQRYDNSIKFRDWLANRLAKAQESTARYNRERRMSVNWSREVQVYGYAFPDSDKPLGFHFGRTKTDALRFARVDDEDFREKHDPDLELVQCLVRFRPDARRVPVREFYKHNEADRTETSEATP